jgi:hypothetical protein
VALERGVPERVSAAIMACLAPEPDERPTPTELLAELESGLARLPRPWLAKLKPRPGRR